jgi:hypothetical protein
MVGGRQTLVFQSTQKNKHSKNNTQKQILTREQLKESCRANPQIAGLIERNVKILKGIDRQITSDFARKFLTKISLITAKEGEENKRKS